MYIHLKTFEAVLGIDHYNRACQYKNRMKMYMYYMYCLCTCTLYILNKINAITSIWIKFRETAKFKIYIYSVVLFQLKLSTISLNTSLHAVVRRANKETNIHTSNSALTVNVNYISIYKDMYSTVHTHCIPLLANNP